MKVINNLVDAASKSEHIDEHGWEFGIDSDGKNWEALNWDVYGYAKDIHSGRMLAVIQVRKSRGTKWGINVKKSYFLLGRNEDNTTFAHAVESKTVHSAIKANRCVIKAVQKWIFGIDYDRVIRQGDMAIVPLKASRHIDDIPVSEKSEIMLQDSHRLEADEFRINGSLYAKNPRMYHLPQTHPEINGDGWCKISVGKRGKYYNFAPPTAD